LDIYLHQRLAIHQLHQHCVPVVVDGHRHREAVVTQSLQQQQQQSALASIKSKLTTEYLLHVT
jgi:hypothetical protein